MLTMKYPGTRNVLIFYTEAGISKKEEQFKILETNKQGVLERDIAIDMLHVSEEANAGKTWKILTTDAFTFILVGKDGTEKMRSNTVVTADRLFAIIDAMPMRKQEMRNK